jgi:multiple sugar transport system substrate-binding protein
MTYRTLRMPALLAGAALVLAACGSGFESEAASEAAGSEAPGASTDASAPAEPGADLTILIGSSGDAETDIVNQLVADWSARVRRGSRGRRGVGPQPAAVAGLQLEQPA